MYREMDTCRETDSLAGVERPMRSQKHALFAELNLLMDRAQVLMEKGNFLKETVVRRR